MNYYLQEQDASTGQWIRIAVAYQTALEALEYRDELIATHHNNGIPFSVRVVSDSGQIIEYEVTK